MPARSLPGCALVAFLVFTSTQVLAAQALAPPLRDWHSYRPIQTFRLILATDVRLPPFPATPSPEHGHTMTGLLIGGLVGTVATGVFLAAFCSDPDTQCGADEVGRAILIIAVPPTVVGAVIGSLIRTGS